MHSAHWIVEFNRSNQCCAIHVVVYGNKSRLSRNRTYRSPEFPAYIQILHVAHMLFRFDGHFDHDVCYKRNLRIVEYHYVPDFDHLPAHFLTDFPKNRLWFHFASTHVPSSAQISANVGFAEGSREILASANVVTGIESPHRMSTHRLRQ